MTITTIKVPGPVRDRLKRAAEQDGVSLGAEIARLLDARDRRHAAERDASLYAAHPETGDDLEEFTAAAARTPMPDLG
ncbi:MAG: hypothetical protein ACRDTU_16450 [Micromonosporaceae bacterium]